MTTITEFLLARIAEDEAVARAMVEDDGDDTGLEGMFDDLTTPGATHWLKGVLSDEFAAMLVRYVVPARALREVEAKRAIVGHALGFRAAADSATGVTCVQRFARMPRT